ncbi:hypothetical protein DI487_14540 [Flavobacterium sediminis]|uniref:Cyclic nucleotide-binding domain-containing protein n=1 Tax=Flavobacterium sediminis TaxID=2201181 RepID=A0A2U8QXK4_9FLAO|nr:Crp/Fnr family transcriptional regulator [Flavobacterium sediminis]AWM14947.1 hypothetical protein DI487_14540 [Flavobacterium sediminis]
MKDHLLKYNDFTENEINYILNLTEEKEFKKKEHILTSGDKELYQYFILSGCIRGYIIDFNGKEHNIEFGFQNYWFGDMESFAHGTDATYNYQALEDLTILAISKRNWDKLSEEIPAFIKYTSELYRNAMIFQQKRIAEHFILTAEQRYFNLIANHPDILQRISLKNIASYLGITAEFISILRKKSIQR